MTAAVVMVSTGAIEVGRGEGEQSFDERYKILAMSWLWRNEVTSWLRSTAE